MAFVMALAVAAYGNALGNGYVLDDVSIIVENPVVRHAGDVRTIFTTAYWAHGGAAAAADDPSLYRPFTIFTYALDFAAWDLNAAASHAVNVVLHAVTSGLVCVLAAGVIGSLPAAVVAASVFAVHPLHTEAVTGIVGRADVLATLFFLLAFVTLRRGRDSGADSAKQGAMARSAAGAVLWLLGLFSKESAATLPLVLMLDDWLHRDEFPSDRGSARRLLTMRYGALGIAAATYLVLRHQAVSGDAHIWPGFAGMPALERALTASRVLMEYLGLFIFPRRLLADYWTSEVPAATSVTNPAVLLSLLLWLVTAVLVLGSVRRDRRLPLIIAWFFITIAPVSNLLFPIGVAKAERLTYLPSVGLCLIVGWAFATVEVRLRSPMPPRLAVGAIVAAFTLRTAVRNRDWRDNLTLALATLETSPSSPLMNDVAAGELVRQGEAQRAMELLREAVRQAPDLAFLRAHLGAVYYRMGMTDSAVFHYREALRRNPADADSHNNLGVVYLDQQRNDEAVAEFLSATELNPGLAGPHTNLGSLYLERGRLPEAIAEFSAAVRLDPTGAEAHNNLGVAFARIGQVDRAAAEYREALRLAPAFEKARANLSRLGEAGRLVKP